MDAQTKGAAVSEHWIHEFGKDVGATIMLYYRGARASSTHDKIAADTWMIGTFGKCNTESE